MTSPRCSRGRPVASEHPISAVIKSSEPVSVSRIVEVLDLVADDLRTAESGRDVYLSTWLDTLAKDKHLRHALLRTLFLVLSVYRITADDVEDLRHKVKMTDQYRRAPSRVHREPRERQSPRLV